MPTITLSSTMSGDRVSGRVVADVHRPALDARPGVERDEEAVERADVDGVVEDGDAAVDARKTEVEHARRDRPCPFPERLAAAEIECADGGRT
jgi:hypothetical protein